MVTRKHPMRIVFICLGAAALSLFTGCIYQHNAERGVHDFGARTKNDPKTQGEKMYGTLSDSPFLRNNTRLEYSPDLSNKLSSLSGVASAIVVLTDKNAYVAVMLDATGNGVLARGNSSNSNNGTRPGKSKPHKQSDLESGYDIAASDHGHITVENHNDLSAEFKQYLATNVRKLSPHVYEVHISASTRFNNFLGGIAREVWLKHELQPLLPRFNKIVQIEFAND